jgi:hypothetical protein
MKRVRYYAYLMYAEIASSYYAIKDRNKPIPSIVCQICGKPGHVERLCPNAWRMGFLDRENEYDT